MKIDFGSLEQQIRQEVQQPAALSSALSELNDCQRFACYLKAILVDYWWIDPEQTIRLWVLRRAQLWLVE